MREKSILIQQRAAEFNRPEIWNNDSDISEFENSSLKSQTSNSLETFRNTEDERDDSPVFLRAKRHLPNLQKK